jgi:hypothetical protein
MAYENYDAFGGQETEEDRRRRLEQEALAQAGGAKPGLGTPNETPEGAPVAPVSPDQLQQNVQVDEQRAQREAQARALQQQAALQQQQPAPQQDQGGLGNINPINKQQYLGQQPVPQPAPQPVSQFSPGYGQQGPGMRMPQQMAQPGINLQAAAQKYQEIQDDPLKLLQFGTHAQVPTYLQDRAKSRAADIINQQRDKQQAQEQLQTMSPSDLASALKQRTSGGSWLKAIAFGMLGMQQSAQEEAAKLGLGKDTYTQINGQPAIVKMSANGTPINGYNAATGKALTPEELVMAAQYSTVQKGAETHTGKMQDVTTGEVYYERTTPQGIQLVDNNGKIYKGASNNLRPFGIGSDINTKNTIQLQELQNKLAYAGPTASAEVRERIIGESEAKFGPLPEEYKRQIRGGTPSPAGVAQNRIPPGGAPAATTSGVAPWQGNPADLVKQALTITNPTDRQGAINSLVKQYGPDAVKQLVAQATQPQQAQRPVAPVAQAPQAPVAAPVAPIASSPAQREAQLKAQQEAEAAEIQKQKELDLARLKPPEAALGTNAAQDVKNQYFADQTYSLVQPIASLIKESTGSGLGTSVDTLASKIGVGTKGQQNIAKLEVLAYPLLANTPRFEGSQSDYDVQVYKQASGAFADSKKPVEVRLAALQAMVTLMKKYDKAGKNDWSFGEKGQPGTAQNPIKLN